MWVSVIYQIRIRTTSKKFRASVLAMKEWLRSSRSQRLPDLIGTFRRKLQGYWNYYAIRGNSALVGKLTYLRSCFVSVGRG